jgi:hypothetical protein
LTPDRCGQFERITASTKNEFDSAKLILIPRDAEIQGRWDLGIQAEHADIADHAHNYERGTWVHLILQLASGAFLGEMVGPERLASPFDFATLAVSQVEMGELKLPANRIDAPPELVR